MSTTVIVIICIVALLIIVVACIIIGALWKKQEHIDERFSSLAANYQVMEENPQHSTIGLSAGGAKDVNTFRKCIRDNIMPSISSITYNGLLYEYYFDTKSTAHNVNNNKESMLFYPTYCYAKINQLRFIDSVSNDIDEYEYYMSVGLNSNILQNDFKRKHLNLMIILDRSGSMNDTFYNDDSNLTLMEVANEAVVILLDHLTENDRFGMLLFDEDVNVIQKFKFMNDINLDKLKKTILSTKPNGGTSFEVGYKKTIELYNTLNDNILMDNNYDNRIIFLTDAQPNTGITEPNSLLSMINKQATGQYHIYTTFIGIGLDFNANLIETISQTRGCNYYSVKSTNDFKDRMKNDFEFMVTPLVFNVSLEINCEGNSCFISKIYGSDNNDDMQMIQHKEITKIHTLFPAPKSKKTGKYKTAGGIKLIKLRRNNDNDNDNINVEVIVKYEDRNGKIFENKQYVTFKSPLLINKNVDMIETDENEEKDCTYDKSINYYDNCAIRKAILLCKYVELIKNWIKSSNNNKVLNVNKKYKLIFTKFMKHFKKEIEFCDDITLAKELKILQKLISIK